MSGTSCGYCLLYSYISYLVMFCCLIIREFCEKTVEFWKNNVSTRGFKKYEIISKIDEEVIDTESGPILHPNDKEEQYRIDINKDKKDVLKNWTMHSPSSNAYSESTLLKNSLSDLDSEEVDIVYYRDENTSIEPL